MSLYSEALQVCVSKKNHGDRGDGKNVDSIIEKYRMNYEEFSRCLEYMGFT